MHRRRADNTQGLIPLRLSAFLFNTQQPAPADGEKKNRCQAGWFSALTSQIPAAALRNQGRRFPLPSAGRGGLLALRPAFSYGFILRISKPVPAGI